MLFQPPLPVGRNVPQEAVFGRFLFLLHSKGMIEVFKYYLRETICILANVMILL